MPIVVRHTPVGAIGRAAVAAGRARGSQLQAGRDIQLTSMALAAQGQRFAIEARERERSGDRAFAMQQAAAAQMARRQPATGDALAERQQLRRTVTEAKAAGIYSPVQIKQMEIAANLGDKVGLRGLISKIERPSARRQELQKQAVTVGEIAQKNIDVIQRRLDTVNKQIEKDFSPEAQQFLRENPRFATPGVQKLLAQQQQLGQEIAGVQQGAAAKQQALGLGISISQQMAFGMRQEARLTRAEAAEQKRIDKQITDAEKLTAIQRANISTVRRHSKEIRDDYDREIGLLRREFGQYVKESDTDYAAREDSIWNRIAEFEGRKMGVFTEEKDKIQKIINKAVGKADEKRLTKGQIYTNALGQRARFTGYNEVGRPMMDLVE